MEKVAIFFTSLWSDIVTNLFANNRWQLILQGLGTTITIALCAILIGTIIGFIIVFMRMSKIKILGALANIYISIIRGIPLVTQLMIFYFVIFGPLGVDRMIVAVIGFGINSGAYIAEILRSGIQAIDIGQTEAGRSLGLTQTQTMFKIILPQAIKNVLPTYTNEFVVLIKETSVAGFIAVQDLTKVSDIIRNATYNAWVPLISAAIIYFVLTSSLAKLFSLLERRLAQSDRR